MSECSATETIFFHALEKRTTAERMTYLDKACAGNEPLRRQVERLLASHPQVGTFLERPVVEAAELAGIAPPEMEEEGDRVNTPDTPFDMPEGEIRLDFLGPSQRPGGLGRLGQYEMLEVVGKGGMGIVLRAFDEKLHRVVAIKALAPALASSAEARERFVREAQSAAAVSHDNVITIHAVEDTGPVPYLVMPFIDGPTLQSTINREGPLSLELILHIAVQIAAGLAAAHAHGLVHRDVKPANILLENGVDRVKITDFGLAQAVDDHDSSLQGMIVGTPTYMSPEQARGEAVDHRSDLFSFGSVLYALCAGDAPFRGSSTRGVLQKVREAAPEALSARRPEIPDWLEAMVVRLHAKDPALRFQAAGEVADLLQAHLVRLRQEKVAGNLAGRSSEAAGEPAQEGRAPRAVPVLLACAVGLLVIAALSRAFVPRRAEPGIRRLSVATGRTESPVRPRKLLRRRPGENLQPAGRPGQANH